MKTNDLIDLLAKDCAPAVSLDHVLNYAALAGALMTGIAFFSFIGVRDDAALAVESPRFLFKFVVTLALAVSAGALLRRVGKPGLSFGRWGYLLLIPMVLLVGSAVLELWAMRGESWLKLAIGHNALNCLMLIPLLSVGPLACFVNALRKGAPENPGLAGAIAGLAAAGIAATFYAANCNDDSPLFVVTWYPIAVASVSALGYFAGKHSLRW